MGYHIKFLPHKKSIPQWKVQFISFKKSDTQGSKAKKPKREWDIAKDRWLNAQIQLKRQEEQLRKVEETQNQFQLRHDSVLPSEFIAKFEKVFVRKSDSQTEQGLRRTTRSHVVWRAAQRMIIAVGVEPSHWVYSYRQIYEYMIVQKMSVRYAHSVLCMANFWGYFISHKMARPFLPVKSPRGYDRLRLIEANCEKISGVARASKPISPKELEKAKCCMNQRNFNWLFISVWFGLRPKEIDGLRNPELWRAETLANWRKILWVFQTKIIALPREDRWKPIPLIFSEQKFALRIIESGNFKRPLMKTMNKHFEKGTTSYAGRKGFSDLMLSKEQSFENISVWMGHSSLQRTWKSYKSRRRFHLAGYPAW
ncbi:MAG: hypothetical protein A2Z20_08555 [Bdellovibrionales bacterium RBG_16_40_8]|nr:MAG: hypothetical protein A2Z20_08555 [Bdellovibrionales bacterium RBG_16_40_8]